MCIRDSSQEMLEKCKKTISLTSRKGVEFILGDTSTALNNNIVSDLVIFNMVLHHIPTPAKIFRDAYSLLDAGGNLLIIDLCSHDQDWVRDSCGDLWLGFEEDDLNHWAKKAKLLEGQSSYSGTRTA